MKDKKLYLLLSILAALVFLSVPASAQDSESPAQAVLAPVNEKVDQAMSSEEQSIYGEVQSVSAEGTGALTVQYYDYDADDEKVVTIAMDINTRLENAGSIADIKKGDWADVAYSTSGGKNKAVSVIVEKEEEAAVASPAMEATVSGDKATASKGVSN